MIEVLLFFLAAALLLYVILGGADYGAGIIELLPAGALKDEQRQVINRAMGPVWEANHMWLIIIVVILFMGFPPIFLTTMIHLHIPVVALLLGIIVRGTAFTFRHYDAIHAPRSQAIYSRLFGFSSLWSAFWFGVIGSALERGTINPGTLDFHEAYVAPWWGRAPLVMGLFVIAIFTFLASVFLIGETDNAKLKRRFRRIGLAANIAVVLFGGIVFLVARMDGSSLPAEFFSNPLSLTAFICSTLLFGVLWNMARKGSALLVRIVAAGQIALILFGWFAVVGAAPLRTVQGEISFYSAAAPEATVRQLVLALCIGSLLIFPSLIGLLRVFKFR